MAQVRDNQLLQKIALVVKELRGRSGLTQDDVFDALRIHIGRIESAKANVSVSTLARICSFFNVTLSEFFQFVENVDEI